MFLFKLVGPPSYWSLSQTISVLPTKLDFFREEGESFILLWILWMAPWNHYPLTSQINITLSSSKEPESISGECVICLVMSSGWVKLPDLSRGVYNKVLFEILCRQSILGPGMSSWFEGEYRVITFYCIIKVNWPCTNSGLGAVMRHLWISARSDVTRCNVGGRMATSRCKTDVW